MKTRNRGIALVLVCCSLMTGCVQKEKVGTTDVNPEFSAPPSVIKSTVPDINDVPLKDDPSLYSVYDPTEVVCFYLTVRKGTAANGTDHSFAEVNSSKRQQGTLGDQDKKADVLVQIGNEIGPLPGEIGYGSNTVNGTINVRGNTSRGFPQKSYRISLYDNAGLWRGQRDIALNKHAGDTTRLRNMIYFNLLQSVPGMVSLRTQFVHLYIKDETDQNSSGTFDDYGLFTQVELPNKRFLRNHGLSIEGNLYKAIMFEMYRYSDKLKLTTDNGFDRNVFNSVLESKGSDDHTKLLKMLDDVNNYRIPIEDVIQNHFNIDNLTSYLAFNILLANTDSNSQNHFLYSPVNCDIWYYICWDGDGSLTTYEKEVRDLEYRDAGWERGLSNYWGNVLFKRMLKVPAFRDALTAKVDYLHKVITPERISNLITRYSQIVAQYTTRMPDAINMTVSYEQQAQIYKNMSYDTERAYQYYMESLKNPMPFFMGSVQCKDGHLELGWDVAYDFNSEIVQYDIQVANDWSFDPSTVVWESKHQVLASATIPMLDAGVYYWRVVATNESGFTQVAFDQTVTALGECNGVRSFQVNADGTVSDI